MRTLALIVMLAMLAGCGDRDPVSQPDAATCTCSPAADCVELACACPSNFVPAAPTYVTGRIVEGLPQIPGLLAGIGQFDEAGKRHAILVGYDPATAPVHESIDIATSPFVIGFGYDIDPLQEIRSAYRVISGTLRFERVCPEGVTGTVTNAALVEIDLFDNLAPIPDGCTFELPAVSFAIAGNCEPP
jgi:hypothetical protein